MRLGQKLRPLKSSVLLSYAEVGKPYRITIWSWINCHSRLEVYITWFLHVDDENEHGRTPEPFGRMPRQIMPGFGAGLRHQSLLLDLLRILRSDRVMLKSLAKIRIPVIPTAIPTKGDSGRCGSPFLGARTSFETSTGSLRSLPGSLSEFLHGPRCSRDEVHSRSEGPFGRHHAILGPSECRCLICLLLRKHACRVFKFRSWG